MKLVVKAKLGEETLAIIMLFSLFAYGACIQILKESLFMVIAVLFIIVFMIVYLWGYYKNKRLTAYQWGIVFRNIWGKVRKVKYEEITMIRIVPGRSSIILQFYDQNVCVGTCNSRDINYSRFMKYLYENMADKIEW